MLSERCPRRRSIPSMQSSFQRSLKPATPKSVPSSGYSESHRIQSSERKLRKSFPVESLLANELLIVPGLPSNEVHRRPVYDGPAPVGESDARPLPVTTPPIALPHRSLGCRVVGEPMAPAPSSQIPRRTIPPAGPTLSVLGMTVIPALTPGASGDRAVVERLRQARRAGVTTFDVAGSVEPARSERLLAQAFPQPDEDLVVIVGRRVEDLVYRAGPDERAPAGADGARERLVRSLEDSGRRLAPHGVRVVEWSGRYLPELDRARPADPSTLSLPLFRRLPNGGDLPDDGP